MSNKPENIDERERVRPTGRQAAMEWLRSIAVGFVLFMVVRAMLVQTFSIVSGSMENTLLVGDFLVVNKAAYGAMIPGIDRRLPGYDSPRRGDVVVFHDPEQSMDIVKRIVGVPGDTLFMRDGTLHLNGEAQNESWVIRRAPDQDGTSPEMAWQTAHRVDRGDSIAYRPTRDDWGPLVVPPDSYFVLGDNRDESRDSRYRGFVPHDLLKGRVAFLYFSWTGERRDGRPLAVPRVRWSRIGDRIR